MIDFLSPLQEPIRLFYGFMFLCGLWVLGKMSRMVYYEWKFYKGAGEDYLRYGYQKIVDIKFYKDKYGKNWEPSELRENEQKIGVK